MKKAFILIASLLLFSLSAKAQDEDVLDIETSVEKISDNEYDLIFEIYIEEDWHLYSQYNPENASAPLKFSAAEGQTGFTLEGKAKESETHKEYSETWEMDETFFKEEARLVQKIKVDDTSLKSVSIDMKAQICKDFCLPFEGTYEFKLNAGKAGGDNNVAENTDEANTADSSSSINISKYIKPLIAFVKQNPKVIYIGLAIGLFFGFLSGLIVYLIMRKK